MLFGFSVIGFGDDANGRYFAEGLVSCGNWVEYRMGENSAEEEWWIRGYITAYNSQTPKTFDIKGNADLNSIFLWMDKWCQENPLKDLADGMYDLTNELYPNRTVKEP
jgi:hypothetical protein